MDNNHHHHHHETKVVHVLILLCPTQGHINPLVQFAKRLTFKGLKATIVTTHYTLTSIDAPGVSVEHISDGLDQTGFVQSSSAKAYMEQFEKAGSESLSQLIRKLENTRFPVSCVVYDSFLPWGLDVAKEHGLLGATFFTTSAAVYSTYFHFHSGLLKSAAMQDFGKLVSLPGLPSMGLCDLPSFLTSSGSNSDYFALVMNQFSNLEMADWVFGNTFELLEEEVVKAMSSLCPIVTIGPMVPSTYLDGRIQGDKGYGADLLKPIGDECLNWLGTKPCKSVVYVSFGSRIKLTKEQIEEIAMGLKETGMNFLWVLKESEKSKLPDEFMESTKEHGLLVPWCVQLEVLAHQATGCFITHCGWNSTLEGLSLGVPMVTVPQWTDQPTNAKFVQDVWGVGVRAQVNEKGIVSREELQCCIREVLVGDMNHEIEWNASKWKALAKEAISEGGSSDKNLDKFVGHLLREEKKKDRLLMV